jgi:acyl dehydratase
MASPALHDLRVGAALPALAKGRLTTSHLVRWCAAQENWAKIHYDETYARERARLPGVLVNGALKQHFLAQFLAEAFHGAAWVLRVDYQFTGMDLAGHALEVRGSVSEVEEKGDCAFAAIDLAIFNLDAQQATTTGRGIVALRHDGKPMLDAVDLPVPDRYCLDIAPEPPDGEVPECIRAAVGSELDRIESAYPLDLSRTRLFAEAVMGLRPVHYDPRLAAESGYGAVVAPPLYPLHGIDLPPGTLPLGEDPEASGREAVAELPRDLASRFGIAPKGSLNGGSRIEVHSLLRVGERIMATSELAGVKRRAGRSGRTMLIFDTINRFREARGRPLLTERHASIYRID